MGLTIHGREQTGMAKITVDRRLWLDADGSLVEDGDPSAAFLWAVSGRQVSRDEAERLGYAPKSSPKKVACDVDGCDYEGTKRGLKIHTGQVHGD